MTSEAKGYLIVPVWCDSGVIKPIADDTGTIPVTESSPITELDVTLVASDITLPVEEQTPLTELDVTIKASDITIPVAEQSPITTLIAQLYAYFGASWIKQSPIWGFTQSVPEYIAEQSDGSAAFYQTFTVVPSGYVDRIDFISATDMSNACTYIQFELYDGTGWRPFYRSTAPAGGAIVGVYSCITLGPGENIRARYQGTTNLDNLRICKQGYRMKLT